MSVAARSFWKGHMRLALVTIPIRLVTAADSEDKVAFHQVDRTSKKRIRYQKVAGEGGKPVEPENIVQGFELESGDYVLLESEELDALKLATRHTLELVEFVDSCSIDPLYFDRPYYILPDGDVAEEGYRVIRDALRTSKKVGVGQLTIRGRENLVAVKPCGLGLLLETLRYESEIKDADAVFSDIGRSKLRPDLIAMATQLIEERSGDFDPGDYKNHYADAIRDLVNRKRKGGDTVLVEEGGGPRDQRTVIDFMEALRRSTVKSSTKKSRAPKTPARTVTEKRPRAAASQEKKSRQRR